jgi:hypothetical protein
MRNPHLRLGSSILVCACILVAYILFTLAFLPKTPGLPILMLNPEVYESVKQALAQDWTRLLLPFEYESSGGSRIYWISSTIPLVYAGQTYLGPVGSYLLFSSLFISTSFVLARIVSRSLEFAATLAFLFAFGTQLNYAYTYGGLTLLYLVLTYAGINFAIGFLLISGRISGWRWQLGFAASLCLVALSSEFWINYAVAVIVATGFGVAWAWRHGQRHLRSSMLIVLATTTTVLAAYLTVRLRVPGQFVAPGGEEELAIFYQHRILLAEDLIVNFFTYLYMVLTNYLPSFVTSSSSLTYLGPDVIVAEQRGYDAPHQALVVMSHLFLWRFYAGIVATLFIGFLGYAGARAWRTPSIPPALITALALMVIAGFSTHLLIKMRPYMSVPALGYKAVISTAFWTILLTYLTTGFRNVVDSSRVHVTLVGCVWLSAFLAALTLPGMQARTLAEVGLSGLRDPLGDMLQWLK